jgi:signal transduction histidine kinase
MQEALSNVSRHSGATGASVVLERRGETLVAIVEDNGRGFTVETLLGSEHSLGLHGMRERAALVGGSLTIESSPRGGTTVFVQVPLAAGLADRTRAGGLEDELATARPRGETAPRPAIAGKRP